MLTYIICMISTKYKAERHYPHTEHDVSHVLANWPQQRDLSAPACSKPAHALHKLSHAKFCDWLPQKSNKHENRPFCSPKSTLHASRNSLKPSERVTDHAKP